MIAVHVVNWASGGALNIYGIYPRDSSALPGILIAPWLHANWGHLFNNLWALALFGALAMLRGPRVFLIASAIIIGLGGLILWVVGRGALHVGASLWIFGLWSYVIAQAWFDRRARTIAIALGVAIFYGGFAYGLLPNDATVSFEGHICGAIAGIFAAYALHRRTPRAVPVAAHHSGPKFWG